VRRAFQRRRIGIPAPAGGLKIGIYGGTFDPPHAGHEHVLATAMKRLQLDWVWILPARGQPLKGPPSAFGDRLDAVRSRLSGPRRRISGLEEALGVQSTIELVLELRARAPQARFVLLIGADNLVIFHRWRRWRELARRIPIAIIDRPGCAPRAGLSRFARTFPEARVPETEARRVPGARAPAWSYLRTRLHPASSTSLRTAWRRD